MSLAKAALLGLMIPAATILPAMAEGGPGHDPAMLFERLDADGDGAVTLSEIEAMRAARFAEADANGDGRLDRDELVAAAEPRAERGVDRMIGRFDSDGDGAISAEEFAEGRSGRRGPDPARLVARFDTDGDGALTAAEFEAGLVEMRAHRGPRGGGHGHGPERG